MWVFRIVLVALAVAVGWNSASIRSQRDIDAAVDRLNKACDRLEGLHVTQTNNVEVSRAMSEAELRDSRMRARENLPTISYGGK